MHKTKLPANRTMTVFMLAVAMSCSAVEAFARWPTGRLGEEVGTFLTIEGERQLAGGLVPRGPGKDPRRLLVDKVNGVKLPHPVPIVLDNALLEVETRYVLRGYETGQMIGDPPGIEKEQAYMRKKPPNQAFWSFHTSFIVTSVVEPAGVEIDEDPGHTDWIVRDAEKAPAKPATSARRAATPAAR
jgi:hypothetical protein